MPTRDAQLNLSPNASDLPLVVTNVLSASTLDLEGTPLEGLAVRLNVGYTLSNTSLVTGTLNVIVHAASSTPVASSDPIVGQPDTPLVLSSLTAGATLEQIIPFTTSYRYVRCEFAIAGLAASDSPSISLCDAYVVEQVGLNWTRAVSFH
jgi:hypothetical protein